jgi:hypothetical protein
MFNVQIVGDESRTLLQHGSQHPLATLVYERDFVEIHDALTSLNFTVFLLPGLLQFIDPRRDETSAQRPAFLLGGFSDRDLQHEVLPSPLSLEDNANEGPEHANYLECIRSLND